MCSFFSVVLAFPMQVRVKSPRLLHLTATALLVFTASLLAASTLHADELKIMSFNVSRTDNYADDGCIRILQGLDPDVCMLQEWSRDSGTYATDRAWVDAAFGSSFSFYAGTGSSGTWTMRNGIVSRYSITSSGSVTDTYVGGRYYDWAVIDIPGDTDLQVMSIHLKASPGPTERTTRENEANEIKTWVQSNFSDSEYILIGGDLNTYHSPAEPCLTVFASFLDYDDHIPADRFSDSDTNLSNRSQRYDWLMPNSVLDDEHTTLTLGVSSYTYTEGIVFESQVFPSVATELPPILYDDSFYPTDHWDNDVCHMDHCPVMKSYDILSGSTQLLITEVRVTNGLYDPLSLDSDWVEVCLKRGSIDMSTVYMTDHDSVYPIGNNGTLTMGYDELNGYDILIIHDAAGTSENNSTGKGANDLWDIYQSSLSLSDQDDQFIITWQNSANPDAENTYDAVCWSNDDGSMNSGEVSDGNDLISKSHWGAPYVGQGTFATGDQSPAIGDIDAGYIQRVNTMDWDDVNDWTISATHSFGIRPDAGILRLNFQPYGSSTPSDYMKDWAQDYGNDEESRYEYGWH